MGTTDSEWPMPYATELNITEPKTYEERCTVAERLVREGKLTIPCLIDGIDKTVNDLYQGRPTRIFLIRKDGKLGVAGSKGPFDSIFTKDRLQILKGFYARNE